MRKMSNEELSKMSGEELIEKLVQVNAVFSDDKEVIKAKLKEISHTQHLKIWHDLSTLANHGHLIFMVACLYDPA
jgi:ferredoxin-fold anticodon binding domain-containing protein